MPSQLLTYTPGHVAWLVLVLGIAIGIKALASTLRTWIEETSRTRRLGKALEDCRPNQRREIILAISELEGRAAGESNSDVADEAILGLARRRSPVPLRQSKRGRKRRRD